MTNIISTIIIISLSTLVICLFAPIVCGIGAITWFACAKVYDMVRQVFVAVGWALEDEPC